MYLELIKSAKKYQESMQEDYRQLHKIPEKGLQLPKTVAFVKKRLGEIGIEFCDCGKGIVASIGDGEKCILLRADMDALNISEKTALEYASDNGNMHACGHDMHTAMLLGAARLLKDLENMLPVKTVLCFQPGEECLEGAKNMLKAGLIEKTKADLAVMLHVMTNTDLKAGTVIIPPSGVGAAGADFFKVTVYGMGCHGSTPYLGRDPISAMTQILTSLSSLTAREIKGTDGDVLSIGAVFAGNSANVIPETASFMGTLRSYADENRDFIKKRLLEICEGIALSFRCEAKLEITSSAPSFINSPNVRDAAIKALSDGEIDPFIVPDSQKGGGSEDFSYVSREIPSLMLCIAAGAKGDGYTEPLHSPKAKFDENALPYGAATYAAMAFGL